MAGKVFMRNVLKRALDGEQADSDFEADNGNTLTVAVPIESGNEIIGGVYLAENISSITDTIDAIKTSLILFSDVPGPGVCDLVHSFKIIKCLSEFFNLSDYLTFFK